MPRREIPLVAGHYYHVYNRGHNRSTLFLEYGAYIFFLRELRRHVVPKHAMLLAYCLMPNHYHLLIRANTDALSGAMQRLGSSFTIAVNRRFQHVGTMFQGPFRAVEVDEDEYLLHLSRYIHLNPLRARLVKRAENWTFSSYREYLGMRNGTLPQMEFLLSVLSGRAGNELSPAELMQARERYRRFVESYVAMDRKLIKGFLFESPSEV